MATIAVWQLGIAQYETRHCSCHSSDLSGQTPLRLRKLILTDCLESPRTWRAMVVCINFLVNAELGTSWLRQIVMSKRPSQLSICPWLSSVDNSDKLQYDGTTPPLSYTPVVEENTLLYLHMTQPILFAARRHASDGTLPLAGASDDGVGSRTSTRSKYIFPDSTSFQVRPRPAKSAAFAGCNRMRRPCRQGRGAEAADVGMFGDLMVMQTQDDVWCQGDI